MSPVEFRKAGLSLPESSKKVLPIQPEAAALGQQPPYLDVVALAGALLVAAPRVAVEQPRLARPLAEQRRDGALVGELGAVVGGHGAEDLPRAVGAQHRAHALQGVRDAPGVFLRQRQRKLQPAGTVQQREQAGAVLPRALDGVHLLGRGARVLAEGEERDVRPAGRVPRGRGPGRAPPRPVADLTPELHVGQAVVARQDPAVDGRRRQVHRAAVARRHLLGRQPRRRQSLIASSLAAAAGLSASIPRLDETRTESAHSCAVRAS